MIVGGTDQEGVSRNLHHQHGQLVPVCNVVIVATRVIMTTIIIIVGIINSTSSAMQVGGNNIALTKLTHNSMLEWPNKKSGTASSQPEVYTKANFSNNTTQCDRGGRIDDNKSY